MDMDSSMSAPAVDNNRPATSQKSEPKPLRFVTNYGAPHPKRRRIGAACLTCRKRKTACSGERPVCDTCKQTNQECAGYPETTTSAHKRTASDAGARQASNAGEKQNRPTNSTRVKDEGDVELSHKSRSAAGMRASDSFEIASVPTAHAWSDGKGQEALFSGPRNRMPYFRWLGPTAIMPGYKQMVVKVKRQDNERARSSTDGILSPLVSNTNGVDQRVPSLFSNTPAALESDVRTPLSLPFYDTSPVPPSELITHLANTFFTHLGCNYPFLQRERFLRDLEEKQVDAILVDAVCALAARFSTHPLLMQQPNDEPKTTPAEYGHAFAQRAQTALPDTFPCPSVSAVQAALLLAYNEFGESRDSGLWMYLGIAIRMAEDLGMHKLEGLKFKGRTGPTPKMVKRDTLSANPSAVTVQQPNLDANDSALNGLDDLRDNEEQKAVEQERVDTFWAVFFLDRVVSSGTGRRSTLRDKDIEISFPSLDEIDPKSGWPAPFPALIRIVHLYGRVADLLNSIKEPSDITLETPKRLASMESQVTNFYQGLSPRLHFDAVNFQNYMKAGEGTNFVLLHFWFHTLIVLLHQPTLLKTFEGKMLQLFPNSQQLSMSSAKTIADILSYSQLMDAKASLGNPFTTQPIYIAGCAFLKETAEQTATSNAHSRATSPSRKDTGSDSAGSSGATPQNNKQQAIPGVHSNGRLNQAPSEPKTVSKHTLLATAASQHYQLCYKALQSLENYWAGTKYILTILDQKFAGVSDPLLYTMEESESSIERPKPEPAFTSPGWRRKSSWGPYMGNASSLMGSPKLDPSKAIGWTLTGTMNSPNTNLAWHFSSGAAGQPPHNDVPRHSNPAIDPSLTDPGISSRSTYPHDLQASNTSMNPPRSAAQDQASRSSMSIFPSPTGTQVSNADANLLLGLGSPYNSGGNSNTNATQGSSDTAHNQHQTNGTIPYQSSSEYTNNSRHNHIPLPFNPYSTTVGHSMHGQTVDMQNFGDMMIESQDVDMSMLGLDMMPWFDSSYPDHEVLEMFDPGGSGGRGRSSGREQHTGGGQGGAGGDV